MYSIIVKSYQIFAKIHQDLQRFCTLGGKNHYLVVINLYQTSQSWMVEYIHHFELIHHPVFIRARPMHDLSSKVTSGEPVQKY